MIDRTWRHLLEIQPVDVYAKTNAVVIRYRVASLQASDAPMGFVSCSVQEILPSPYLPEQREAEAEG